MKCFLVLLAAWMFAVLNVPTDRSSAADGPDVAVCTQTDSSGRIIRQWTEPAGPVRAKHGFTAATPANQCTGCVGCACPAGDCASGKCPAASPAGQSVQCIGGQCPNAAPAYPVTTATQWRGQTYTVMPRFGKFSGGSGGCPGGNCPK